MRRQEQAARQGTGPAASSEGSAVLASPVHCFSPRRGLTVATAVAVLLSTNLAVADARSPAVRAVTVTALPTPAGWSSQATHVSERGHVVGRLTRSIGDEQRRRMFMWHRGVLTDLGTLGGRNTYGAEPELAERPTIVNRRGVVVGTSQLADGRERAFRWRDGVMTDLGTLPGTTDSRATAVNDRGDVIGVSVRESGDGIVPRGFLWRREKMTDLGDARAVSVNDRGQVLLDMDGTRAAVWEGGRVTPVSGPSGDRGIYGVDLNERGTVLAAEEDGWEDALPTPYRWRSSTRLAVMPWNREEFSAMPLDLNERDEVLAVGGRNYDEFGGLLWRGGVITRLDGLSGVEALNNRSQVAGVVLGVRGEVLGGALARREGHRAAVPARSALQQHAGRERRRTGRRVERRPCRGVEDAGPRLSPLLRLGRCLGT